MNAKPNPPAPGFGMELPDDLQAVYSNVARISHTPFDFVLDFSQAQPGRPHAEILSRIIMSPAGAKLFMRALTENVARFEAVFGEISLPKGDSGLAGDLFKRVQPPESPPAEPPPADPNPPEA
ncbi:MAG: DUF3467 domain-containing protein [Bellilinea sp.]